MGVKRRHMGAKHVSCSSREVLRPESWRMAFRSFRVVHSMLKLRSFFQWQRFEIALHAFAADGEKPVLGALPAEFLHHSR